MSIALLLIDLQNDYFPGGKFPLWNTDETLESALAAIGKAQARGDLIVHIQHIADPAMGIAPFFNQDTPGAEIHPDVLAAAPDAPQIVKQFADSFEQTGLETLLASHSINRLLVCGMMTQNCVTHTAISRTAENYDVTILADACTTIDEMIHNIALHAVSTRVKLSTVDEEYA